MATPQRTQHFLHTYKFRANEQDPIIDRIRTVMEDEGFSATDLSKGSGLAAATISNWMSGKTRRPQYASIVASSRAMGYDVALVPVRNRANGHAWDASMPRIIKRFPSARA